MLQIKMADLQRFIDFFLFWTGFEHTFVYVYFWDVDKSIKNLFSLNFDVLHQNNILQE